MTKLSVNVNKIATLRNARGGNQPNLLKVIRDCVLFGADGITVHPRPDERHIRYDDVYEIKNILDKDFNIEGYPSEKFLEMVIDVKPTQVTLVPDSPNVLTSNQGWNIIKHFDFLKDIVGRLKNEGIRISIFIDADPDMLPFAVEIGADRVELYTEPYASLYKIDKNKAIEPYIKSAIEAQNIGIGLNAGHDLNLDNIEFFNRSIPNLLEVSIGHALICESLYLGLSETIKEYKQKLI